MALTLDEWKKKYDTGVTVKGVKARDGKSAGAGTQNASSSTALSGTNTALTDSGKSRDSFDATVRANYAAAQKTGAPVLTTAFDFAPVTTIGTNVGSILDATKTVQRAVGGGRSGIDVKPVQVPTLTARIANTAVGAAKSVASQYTNTAGMAVKSAQELNTLASGTAQKVQTAKDNIARYQQEIQTQRRNGSLTNESLARLNQLISANNRAIKAAEGTLDTQNAGTGAGIQTLNRTADKLQASSQQNVSTAKQGLGTIGSALVDIGVTGTQMVADAGTAALTGTSALVPMFIRSFGGGAQQARQTGASAGTQALYGLGSGVIETATEKISNVAAPFRKMFGAGILDTAVEKAIGKLTKNTVGKALLTAGASAAGEGFEEFIGDLLYPVLQRATYDKNAKFNLSDALYDTIIGGALGMIGSAPSVINSAANDIMPRLKTAEELGLTQNTENENAASGMETVKKNATDTESIGQLTDQDVMQSREISDTQSAVTLLRNNIQTLQKMQPVANVEGTEVAKTGKATDNAMDFLKSIGNKVLRPDFGEVLFSRSKIKNSLMGHGFGPVKTDMIAAVPAVIQNGTEINFTPNWKGRGYDSYVFAAPVTYKGNTVMVDAVVIRDSANRYYLHEVVDSDGNLIYGKMKSPDTVSDRSAEEPQNTVTDTELSTKTVSQPEVKSKGNLTTETDITPKLGTLEQKNLREDKSLPGGDTVTAKNDGYLDALVSDENAPGERMTPADYARSAEGDRLHKMAPPPEKKREAVSQEDLDDLWKLWEDQASPTMTDSEERRKEALEAASELVTAKSTQQKPTLKEAAGNARSYIIRKMDDSGDSVTRVQRLTKDRYLYPFYNMARASASAGVNMIGGEQTDIRGKRVGDSLNDIFKPIMSKGDDYYNAFQQYLLNLHNVDRMSIVNSENSTAKLEAEAALADFDKENPDIATVTETRLKRKAESIDKEGELAKERLSLLRKVNQADKLGNKPVLGYDVTADMSREAAAKLLREHPEFAKYQKQVRTYIDNLMQYRVDSGLITQADKDFLDKYYPNYVPTKRIMEQETAKTNMKSVRIGKTVGRAQGGTEKIMPLHEALGKQTMQVVREGSKNRFGQRLLENWENHPKETRKYISDAQKYDAGFSADTFDNLDEDRIPQKSNTFTVYKDGKLWEMAVDPSMFDAVKALSPDTQEVSVPVKLTRGLNSLFKKLVTGYNPMFTVRNVARDLQTAGLYSRDMAAFTKNYPLALKEIATDGAYWKQYKALGGVYSSVFDYRTGTVKESSAAVQKTLGRVEALNMAMEQAPRLAEFMSIVKKGDGSMENLMDAMHAAADVTVNFGRSGTVGKMLNANFVPFLNPGIQGFDRMVRRVTETKGAKEWAKLAVRAAALGVAPALLNGLLYRDDKDWDDLRDSDKDTNYLFKIGDGLWLKVPKGRELSVLGMTGQRISDLVKGKDVNWGDFITTVGNQIAPANPLKTNIVSAVADSDLFDKNSPGKTWYGGDIESQRLQNYEPGQRYDSSTDIFSKWLGGQLNLSPKKINYILDQYSGVVGDFVLPLLTPQAERDPFTKAFTVDSVSNNHISEDFYNKGDEITYAKSGGDVSMQAVSRFWNKQISACGDIYTKIREIENTTDLTDAQKRDQVRQAKAVLNGIQKNALATVETYQDSVKKNLKGTSDDAVDQAYREANKECFGAEYALQIYNKDVYAKAQEASQNGVGYSDYYDYYFETKDYAATAKKSVVTQKMEYLQSSGMSDSTKAEIYYADLASDSDLTKQAELEKSSGISGVQYWRYKLATASKSYDIMPKLQKLS